MLPEIYYLKTKFNKKVKTQLDYPFTEGASTDAKSSGKL